MLALRRKRRPRPRPWVMRAWVNGRFVPVGRYATREVGIHQGDRVWRSGLLELEHEATRELWMRKGGQWSRELLARDGAGHELPAGGHGAGPGRAGPHRGGRDSRDRSRSEAAGGDAGGLFAVSAKGAKP